MKIGELAQATQTQVETIRYYEREGILPSTPRTDSNYRIYDSSHVERLAFVRHCRSLDMSLDEIRRLLKFKDSPQADCSEVNALLDEHLDHVATRMRELRLLERQLKALRLQCTVASESAQCGILNGLTKPESAVRTPPRTSKSKDNHVRGPHRGQVKL